MSANQFEYKQIAEAFLGFVETVAKLRDPVSGCPWDLQQTHNSLRRYMIEEAYEAAATMEQPDFPHMSEELGDVLLQVVLNSQLAKESGHFSIKDVIAEINEKMVRRHPHVFLPADDQKIKTSQDVRQQWDEIKKSEKKAASKGGLFTDAEKTPFPALLQAYKIGKIAHKIDFDWDHPREVLMQLKSEIAELEEELRQPQQDQQAIASELSDILFTAAQLCRHFHLDPEVVAQSGNQKFLRRFRQLEELAAKEGLDLKTVDRGAKERLWQRAKSQQQSSR